MKIQSFATKFLSFPLQKAITTNLHTLTHLHGLALFLHTDTGLTGNAFICSLGKITPQEITKHIEDDLFSQIKAITSDQWQKFWESQRNNKLMSYIFALAALDIAIWDLLAKEKNLALHQLLGNEQTKIPVYGTTGWLSLSNEELLQEVKKYAGWGVKAFKIRLGHSDDYQRIKLIRQQMSNDFLIMADANQRYSPAEAIEVANRLTEFNLTWIEEPVGNSFEDLQLVKVKIPIPIAVGENIFVESRFEHVAKNKLADYLQPDVIRCGGITGFLKMADITKKFNMPLCNHLLPELSVSLLSAYKNSYMLEYDDLLPNNIFTEDFSIKDGYMHLPNSIGTGVQLIDEAIKHFSIS